MTRSYAREAVAALWVLALVIVGWNSQLTSVSGWSMVAVLGVIGLVVLQQLWRQPPQTMSESINEARRAPIKVRAER